MNEKARDIPFSMMLPCKVCKDVVDELGGMFLFLLDALRLMFAGWGQFSKMVRQIYFIGVQSVSVIALIGLFSGMVMGMQLYYALSTFGADGFLGTGVAMAMVRELAPVLSAIMLTGRAGSAMTAEIGVMRISEQIDALTIMDINPMRYLVAPKMAACLISFPILTAFFNLISLWGGWLTGVKLLGANEGAYWSRVQSSLGWADVEGCFIKSIVFGLLVCTICCFEGYYTHTRSGLAGPEGVSQSTTTAVVRSCVVILAADYMMTSLLW
jgi:phospholipid/cholesterol/gamma-HCH transport system permease protein